MSRKRRNSSSPEVEAPNRKRRASFTSSDEATDHEPPSQTRVRPQINPETGQTGAFPGLGDDEGELFYGPAADGIDYLRMVRSERRAIPHVLTRQRTETLCETSTETYLQDTAIQDGGENEEGGFFDDGAYTAKPVIAPSQKSHFPQAQTSYYDALLAHFNLIRATMKCVPPLRQVEYLTSSQPISFPQESVAARRVWEDQMLNFDPNPVQIACMDGDTALEILRLAKRKIFVFFRTDNATKIARLGAWLWSVLGKVPDRGQLSSEEIGDLRQLAKRAKAVLKTYEKEASYDEISDDNDITDVDDTEGQNLANPPLTSEYHHHIEPSSGETPLQTTPSEDVEIMDKEKIMDLNRDNVSSVPDLNLPGQVKQRKIIILDMLITVIGEFYGQLDLLDLRTPWQQSKYSE